MEAKTGDDNHLDSNVLLPPRKRLLAGMKKQNGDGNASSYQLSTSMSMYDFDTRLNKWLSAHLGDDNHSHEEIVAAVQSAAEAAVKIAKAARAAAQKKEVKASMAMAAAQKALEFVAAFDEQQTSSYVEPQSKKNKTVAKVHGKSSDEALGHHLHRPINSSLLVLECNSPDDLKEVPIISENGIVANGSVVVKENPASARNRIKLGRIDKNATKIVEKGKRYFEEDPSSVSRKRGYLKQMKPLSSIYGDRDHLNPIKNCKRRSRDMVDENKGDETLFSVTSSAPIERNSPRKCKSFKSAARSEESKDYHDVQIEYHNEFAASIVYVDG